MSVEQGLPGPQDWPGVEVWRGGVNTWECDEMGHMNVRFYVAKAMEGLVGLAALLGMPHAFTEHANATLLVRDQHIRFLREAHAGAALSIKGGVVDMGEEEARLLLLLIHADGHLAATFQTVVAHVTPAQGRAFPWSAATRRLASSHSVTAPGLAQPRSLDLSPVEPTASLSQAQAVGLLRIGLGAFNPSECDQFGRMRAEQFVGRVSDGIAGFIGPIREIVAAKAAVPPTRVGGAVLEYRLRYLDWPRSGERFEIRSGLAGFEGRTTKLVHWLLDPESGAAWGTSEATAITFDLDARKAVPISPAAAVALEAHKISGLRL